MTVTTREQGLNGWYWHIFQRDNNGMETISNMIVSSTIVLGGTNAMMPIQTHPCIRSWWQDRNMIIVGSRRDRKTGLDLDLRVSHNLRPPRSRTEIANHLREGHSSSSVHPVFLLVVISAITATQRQASFSFRTSHVA
jgi:hypothetical protein